jgi:predicted nucleic-acid-binding Zn-ribbon protein
MSEYTCPDCASTEVTLTHEQQFMANTGEHYCHSVKIQDSDSKAYCITCGWSGFHDDLIGYKE